MTTRYVSGTQKPGQTHIFSRVYVCFYTRAHRFKLFIRLVCRKLKVFPIRAYLSTLLNHPIVCGNHPRHTLHTANQRPSQQHRGKVHCVTTWKDRIVSASDDGTLYVQTDLGHGRIRKCLPCLPSNRKEPPIVVSIVIAFISLSVSLVPPHPSRLSLNHSLLRAPTSIFPPPTVASGTRPPLPAKRSSTR